MMANIKDYTQEEFNLYLIDNYSDGYTDYPSHVYRVYEENYCTNWLFVEWTIGGMDGGNCWDDIPKHFPLSTDDEPDDIVLDRILEEFYPNCSFLEYKKISKDVYEYETKEHKEYYGNYRIVKYRKILVDVLYSFLKEKTDG